MIRGGHLDCFVDIRFFNSVKKIIGRMVNESFCRASRSRNVEVVIGFRGLYSCRRGRNNSAANCSPSFDEAVKIGRNFVIDGN